MDVQQLNQDLCNLLDKKIELNALTYDDDRYDKLEEEIHAMEDKIIQKYGDYLEEALYGVHDEYCPDNEILNPIGYIPNKVKKENGEYKVDFSEGIHVDTDDFSDKDTKLVLLPNPVRIVLQVNQGRSEVVWKGKK